MGKVKCLNCGEILESKHRHDFVRCGCGNETFVDGGNDYLRCGGMDMTMVKVIPETPTDRIARQYQDFKTGGGKWLRGDNK